MEIIKAEKLRYDAKAGESRCRALHDVSVLVKEGELLCILGGSGAGKTSFIHCLNGLSSPDDGELSLCGMDCRKEENHWEIRKKCALVPERAEDCYLSTSVQSELAYALRNFKPELAEIEECVARALSIVGLEGFENRSMPLLSPFERYCVALASAIAYEPDIILIDSFAEGFDRRAKEQLHRIVKNIHQSGKTIIYTTREPKDAIMAERIVLMDKGRVLACDSPRELLCNNKLLGSVGLERPFAVRVYYDLLEAGAQLPACPLDIDELVEEICK